uniref:Glabrous enhancer-binding protein-like DBD domain-containing protein n=1 Tax=Oryza meridionalis TaxID=40149 RepID=A0A0E0EP98_9ORYZ
MAPTIPPTTEEEEEEEEEGPARDKWPLSDQVKILSAHAAHREAGEELPSGRALLDEVKQQLSRERFTARDLDKKVSHLRDRYLDHIYNPPPARRRPHQHHTTLFYLSHKVWSQFQHPPQAQAVHISDGADSASGPIVISSDDSSGHIVISSNDGAGADSDAMVVSLSSNGSPPGPIVLSSSSSEEEPARKKSCRENWSFSDAVKILTALAAHRQAGGELPSGHALFDELQHQLSRERFTARELDKKVKSLKDRYMDELYRPPAARRRPQNTTLFDLSRKAWPDFHFHFQPQPHVEAVQISSSSSSASS